MQVLEITGGLLDYYRRTNPDYEELKIENVIRLTEGWDTIVYQFVLKYRKDGVDHQKPLILRVYPGKDGEIRAEKEFELMASLMMTTIITPDPYRLETESIEIPAPFLVMEHIKGTTASNYIINNPERKEVIITKFARTMVELHSLDWKTIISNPEQYAVSNPYQYIVNTMTEFKDRIEFYGKTEFVPVLRWLVERMDEVPVADLSLLHGDYHLANVIVDEDEELYIIDWLKSSIGDFRVDLAWTLIIHETILGKNIRDIILNAYRDMANYEVNTIKYFEVLAILRQLLDISINFSFSTEASRLNPSAVDKMRDNLEPIKRSLKLLYGHTGIKIPQFEAMLG